jgi:hypothetical protein
VPLRVYKKPKGLLKRPRRWIKSPTHSLREPEAMARYKPYDLNQAKMIPLSYADQIVEGSFEHALNEIVEEHLDLTVFDGRYANDQTGRLAYDPRVLLKVVL